MNLSELHLIKTALTLGPKQSYGVPKWPHYQEAKTALKGQNGPNKITVFNMFVQQATMVGALWKFPNK